MLPPKIPIILIRGRGQGITLSSILLLISLFFNSILTCSYKSDQGANSMFTHFFYMYAALKSDAWSRIIFSTFIIINVSSLISLTCTMQNPCKLLIFNNVLKPDELEGAFQRRNLKIFSYFQMNIVWTLMYTYL